MTEVDTLAEEATVEAEAVSVVFVCAFPDDGCWPFIVGCFSLVEHFSDGWDRSFFDTGYDDYRGGYGGRRTLEQSFMLLLNAPASLSNVHHNIFRLSFHRWWWRRWLWR
jgi:hypothetical protein